MARREERGRAIVAKWDTVRTVDKITQVSSKVAVTATPKAIIL